MEGNLRLKAGWLYEQDDDLEDIPEHPPLNRMEMTADESLQTVLSLERKLTPDEAELEGRAHDAMYVCGGCRFYLRRANSTSGGCELVEGLIQWSSSCAYFIDAIELAEHLFFEEEEAAGEEDILSVG